MHLPRGEYALGNLCDFFLCLFIREDVDFGMSSEFLILLLQLIAIVKMYNFMYLKLGVYANQMDLVFL